MEHPPMDFKKDASAPVGPPGRQVVSRATPAARPAHAVEQMAMRIVTVYVIVAALWILISDPVLAALISDQQLLVKLEVAKGWTFVAVTAALLFFLLRRETRRWTAERAAREEAEAELRESQERFQSIYHSVNDAIFIHDLDTGRILDVNNRMCEMFSCTVEEARAAAVSDFSLGISPYSQTEAVEWMKKTAAGAPQVFLWHCRRKDQGLFWCEVRMCRARLGKDDVIVVTVSDITERKKTETALFDSTERFRQMAENIDEVFWMSGVQDDTMLYVSPAYEKIWGRSCESLYAKPGSWADAIHPDDRERVLNAAATRRSGGSYAETYRILRPNGQVRWIDVRSFPVRDSSGQIYRTVSVAADITSHQQAEIALRESEERFRTVVETAPDAIFIQTHRCFAYLNAAAVKLFGAERAEQVVGSVVLDQIHPDYRAKVTERIRQLNELGQAQPPTELCIVRRDKTEVYAEVTGVPFVFQGEHGALVFAHDITARKRSEEQLRLQEELLNETGQIAKVGGWQIDAVTGEGQWTDQVARIHDLEPGELTSKEVGLGFYTGVSRERIEAALKAAIEHGTSYDLELELLSAKGIRKWVRTIGHPVLEKGKVVRVRGSFQDITEIKAGETALRESEERFRQMAESIDEVFWMTGVRADEMLYVSPAYEKIWGRSCESLYADPSSWMTAIHVDDLKRVLDAARSRPTGVGYSETYRIVHANGHARWVHVRSFPVRDSAGHIYRTVGIAADITEHRKLEDQFRQAQKMEAIGTLAGGIAHDFNNILGAILGYAELAKTEAVPALTERSLDEILRACKRAGDLVKQILAFSRQQEQKRQPLQLWRVVDEALRLLRAALPSTIQFETDLSGEVPNVLADASQIHQVVMNLCTNAAHAMSDRTSGRLGLKLARFEADEDFVKAHPGSRPGVYTRLIVSDNGRGMERAVLERIFEPFFTTKAPGEGTGLGLAVVHGIVQNHEGIITVYSRPGEGTVFNIYFPAHDSEISETVLQSNLIPRGQGQRILVVDDELPLVEMTEKILKRLGYAVETATNPVEALQAIRAEPARYDVILTDLTMPGMSGMELASLALKENPQLSLILMTGFFASLTLEQIRATGIQEVLLKPITIRGFGETIARVLKQKNPPPRAR